jgi:threonine synthase
VAGNYDEANRECRKVAAASGLEFANITLRPFYAEGAKTVAFEIVEQLGWQAPDHIVSATAGGTLSSRLHKGLMELETVGLAETKSTKMHIAQPAGCSPIASAIIAHEPEIQPCEPTTVAHSLAIGSPGDGYLVIDAVLSRHGSAGSASDEEIFAGIDLLATTEGILTEPAGGTTVAVLKKLAEAGELDPDAVVVAIITGNGLKTLDEHPEKTWPSMVECDVESMLPVLSDFQQEQATSQGQPLPA